MPLRREDFRANTWGTHLLDLSQRGLKLEYTVADAGRGLRAGQAEAWPDVPCRGDVFHAEREIGNVVTFLEKRAWAGKSPAELLHGRSFPHWLEQLGFTRFRRAA